MKAAIKIFLTTSMVLVFFTVSGQQKVYDSTDGSFAISSLSELQLKKLRKISDNFLLKLSVIPSKTSSEERKNLIDIAREKMNQEIRTVLDSSQYEQFARYTANTISRIKNRSSKVQKSSKKTITTGE